MISIDFSIDPRRIYLWGQRMGVELREPKQLCDPYSLAQTYLLEMSARLIQYHGFMSATLTDPRMLFTVVRDVPASRSATLIPPGHIIELPTHATYFFNEERRLQWEHVFHNELWFDRRSHVPGANTALDLLRFLQCLLPGMLLVVEAKDGWSTQRGIPSLNWLREHKDILVTSIGIERYNALTHAAADIKRAVIDSRDMQLVEPSYSGY